MTDFEKLKEDASVMGWKTVAGVLLVILLLWTCDAVRNEDAVTAEDADASR